MFFAGISGSAAADTAAIGAVLIPAMIRQGYPSAFAAAVVAAGGALGVIIPPSIPMVIFGFLTNVSIAKLFMGGLIVGIFLGLVMMLIAAWISWRKGYGSRRKFSLVSVSQAFRRAFWALWTPVIVLGGILTGMVIVTEAAALAVFYALFVSMAINHELKWADLPDQILRSQIIAATILLIIAMAKVFTWLVAMKQTSQLLGAVMMPRVPPMGLTPAGDGWFAGSWLCYGNNGGLDPPRSRADCSHVAAGCRSNTIRGIDCY